MTADIQYFFHFADFVNKSFVLTLLPLVLYFLFCQKNFNFLLNIPFFLNFRCKIKIFNFKKNGTTGLILQLSFSSSLTMSYTN